MPDKSQEGSFPGRAFPEAPDGLAPESAAGLAFLTGVLSSGPESLESLESLLERFLSCLGMIRLANGENTI